MTNSIVIYIEEYRKGSELIKHGICFNNSLLIKILIDGESIDELDGFEDAFVVFEELLESTKSSGKYLIFTCACGIAEDGGWEGVIVIVDETEVTWEFELGDKNYQFKFGKKEYVSQVQSILIPLKETELQVEPASVIFPENFNRH